MERPDFIPWMWSRGRWNRRLWKQPQKVVRWFVVASVVWVLLVAFIWSVENDPALRGLALLGAAGVWAQAVVYAPRARRAAKRQ